MLTIQWICSTMPQVRAGVHAARGRRIVRSKPRFAVRDPVLFNSLALSSICVDGG